MGRRLALAGLALGLSLGGPASAQTPEGAPAPGIDHLLKLPSGSAYDVERKGGATKTEWKGRFAEARKEVETARKEYDAAMAKLEKAAAGSDTWRFVPPGGDVTAENQDNLRVRQEVQKKRDELALAERRQKDLDVEASLASVPDDWR
jgi:hypothetical protein